MESIAHFLKNHGIAKLTKVLNQELYLKLRVSIFVSSGEGLGISTWTDKHESFVAGKFKGIQALFKSNSSNYLCI